MSVETTDNTRQKIDDLLDRSLEWPYDQAKLGTAQVLALLEIAKALSRLAELVEKIDPAVGDQ